VLRPLHLDLPEQEAAKEFAGARQKAFLRRIGAFLRRHPSPNRLLPFDEATAALGPWRQAYLSIRTVPVESIVGSEGRYADFDDEFLPPVSRLKVGDAYFVRDGNHRVSVARWLGVEALDAEVAELRAADPVEAPSLTLYLPEGRRHLHPSKNPLYGPPAVGGG
jgi:hypothetical protein